MQERIPTIPVTLRIAGSALPNLRARANWARFVEAGPIDADGWRTVRMTFELAQDAVAVVLGLGEKCAMIAPEQLREEVITRLQRALRQHEPVPDRE
jgi:predicted DNA-binding transcriptional regulator YafY